MDAVFLRDPVHDERQAAVTRVFEVLPVGKGWKQGRWSCCLYGRSGSQICAFAPSSSPC